ncbi:hypothetical protein AGABI1DRAFT_56125 [Agaricus bisporus var. burnettii JB137-S8]|uniref:Peptidase A22B, signal peptide peptidase n=1 Tax=Agaricus bisporus var. burnettii (strain JB137-S8 / ATCC MYA-4627 / FGSC 10392) TaxID=597362 RepID=K5XCS2_AGABU|nr:uncharacterized protein AGABI1DRAFT_56125 [Agaricus bisporus var. burnettii JB137-S8]EKM80937.1 hypothetical protein AGABI1DRAFT_56125 [Agaricus bisporus var. burnettii JB137-S8]
MTGVVDWELLSSYAGLIGLAVLSIYAGSHGSLPKKLTAGREGVVDEEDGEEEIDRMTSNDAWLFPVLASGALLGLYVVVRYLGTEWINWCLNWYFSIIGFGSVWKSSRSLVRWSMGDSRWKTFHRYTFVIQRSTQPFVSLSCRTPTLFLLPVAFANAIWYHIGSSSRKFIFTDILGLSFSHNALSLLRIDSFKTGSILLSGLFFYDIWWVFGTEVMIRVATSLDAPIKLLWPKSLSVVSERGYTMLGLGDIVIPGTFIALALRYDLHNYLSASERTPETKFRKPYFYAGLVAYTLGLIATTVVMHVFRAAQPALLYLSPACILSFVITATFRGELGEAWNWSDGPSSLAKRGGEDGDTKTEVVSSTLDESELERPVGAVDGLKGT